jgi:hypothetical protein
LHDWSDAFVLLVAFCLVGWNFLAARVKFQPDFAETDKTIKMNAVGLQRHPSSLQLPRHNVQNVPFFFAQQVFENVQRRTFI